MLGDDEIRNRVMYHAPSTAGITKHAKLAEAIADAIRAVDENAPDGREKSLAITNLESAKMWASAAVARNPETC